MLTWESEREGQAGGVRTARMRAAVWRHAQLYCVPGMKNPALAIGRAARSNTHCIGCDTRNRAHSVDQRVPLQVPNPARVYTCVGPWGIVK